MQPDKKVGRVVYAERNIFFGYVGQIATAILSFYLRRIFILHLSETLLGINSIYTNVLSILSMAELGIGTALNYSLYAPLAEGNREKIKGYLDMYRKAYRVIAIVVAVLGLCFVPFLRYLIKGPEGVSLRELTIYYLIFLFNTVTTYLVSYKYSLVNAEQKNYIQTNILTITKIITVFFQIIVLITIGNFLAYLLTDSAIQLIQKIFVSRYLDKKYPIFTEREFVELSGEEKSAVWSKTKALLLHRIGDVMRLQTDALVISSLIQVTVAGFVDNYNMVINAVSNMVNVVFNSVISGFGNLVAVESKERQKEVFQAYRFFGAWVYGLSATGFLILLTPLIKLWLGEYWTLPSFVVSLITVDFFFKGDRIINSNFKTAAGVFEEDKYLALIQGVVNLVISVVLAMKIGLPGVFIGTVISGLIANITKPFIIYHTIFKENVISYFADTLRYGLATAVSAFLCKGLSRILMPTVTIYSFLMMLLIVTAVFNGIFYMLFRNRAEFAYLKGIVKRRLKRYNS
ncbi:MAG: polysaccharide biosynthesis protein [Lachnospiraceae bacterium]|nr:polysaccharide biosynthesis protein [Lachnospiraceae bacterium]